MKVKRRDEGLEDAPVIDPVAQVRGQVDAALREKFEAIVKGFQDQREQDIKELCKLQSELEGLKTQKEALMAERGVLVAGIHGLASKGVLVLDQKIQWLEKQIKGCEDQATAIFESLTKLPEGCEFLTLVFKTK